jgi:hypothetical protein
MLIGYTPVPIDDIQKKGQGDLMKKNQTRGSPQTFGLFIKLQKA